MKIRIFYLKEVSGVSCIFYPTGHILIINNYNILIIGIKHCTISAMDSYSTKLKGESGEMYDGQKSHKVLDCFFPEATYFHFPNNFSFLETIV